MRYWTPVGIILTTCILAIISSCNDGQVSHAPTTSEVPPTTEPKLDFTYTIEGDIVTVTGYTWYSMLELYVVIPGIIDGKSVTNVGKTVFSGCPNLISVVVPEGVISIDDDAFIDRKRLTDITLPESLMYIGSYAFAGCHSLKNITIPNSVMYIGEFAFSQCMELTSITIPNGVTSIGDRTFAFCNSLETLSIPSSVTSIGEMALSSRQNLIVFCPRDSYTHQYCVENNIRFELTN